VLTVQGVPRRLCDGSTRRAFLRVGSLGGIGLALPRVLRAAAELATQERSFGRAKRCIVLFLTGGPPQLDTFDMKPDAPAEIRGELKPIATSVPGVHISELCPRLARLANRFRIVRSVTHGDTVHTSAGYTMLTGVPHPQANSATAANIQPTANDHPHFGSLLARLRPPRGVPTFVSLPEVIKDAAVNEFPGQGAGFMGKQFDPFRIEGDTERGTFRLPDIFLPPDVTADRLGDRRLLRDRLARIMHDAESRAAFADLDGFYEQAFTLIGSAAVLNAFRLDREPESLRASYGSHLFGQGCLLARRLIEAGVALVTVYWHYEGPDDSPVWDTHWNNFDHLRNRLVPPTDQAAAALIADLAARGMLDDTLVICMGEFGRTPRINKKAGRDHWPHVQSILLAGAGIRGGVFGASDRVGAYPADSPVTPADMAATILHLLGVPGELELHDRTDRPVRACEGKPVYALIA